MEVNLFLDTNVYLDYFRSSSKGALDPLRRLTALVQSKEITLLLPEQVVHEYQRQRRKVAEETRELLLEASKYAPFAHLVLGKEKREVKSVSRAVKEVKDSIAELVKKYDEQIESEDTEADKLIKRLFKKAKRFEESDELIKRAHSRYLKGNPPRKTDHSYGDAIVWEVLLEEAVGESLTLISKDSDYTERQKGKKALNSFLKGEWAQKSTHGISFYESLGEFINHFDKKETIKKEIVEEEKISSSNGLPRVYYGGGTATGVYYGGGTVPMGPTGPTGYGGATETLFYSSINGSTQPTSIFGWGSGTQGVSITSLNQVSFCPYCGISAPLSSNGSATIIPSRACKGCGRNISVT